MLCSICPHRSAPMIPFLCTMLLSFAGFSQGLRVPFVENIGEATIYVIPNQVDFWLHYQAQAENLEDAMALAKQFPGDVEARLNDKKLNPINVERMPPAVVTQRGP